MHRCGYVEIGELHECRGADIFDPSFHDFRSLRNFMYIIIITDF